MKKLLLVANVSKEHVRKFHIPFIKFMKENGWQVDVACSMDEKIPECDQAFDLPCDRNPFKGGLYKSILILKKIIAENDYDVIHCNTVTGSVIARFAAASFRKSGLKVFYTNHGLHFFKGASLMRWVTGYPMEKTLAPKTDVLITINHSDFEMAQKHLSACGAIEYIHGIGVNLSKFRNIKSEFDKDEYKTSLGISKDDFILIYVAELNKNKNQIALIRCLKYVLQQIPVAKLLLVGRDYEEGKLEKVVIENGLKDSVRFLGWRNDIPELLHISDVYVASSKSEGLGLNLIEAMACNLPVVALKNRGHCEIISHEKNGFLIEHGNEVEMAEYVLRLYHDNELRRKITAQAQQDICKYEVQNTLNEIYNIYKKHIY